VPAERPVCVLYLKMEVSLACRYNVILSTPETSEKSHYDIVTFIIIRV